MVWLAGPFSVHDLPHNTTITTTLATDWYWTTCLGPFFLSCLSAASYFVTPSDPCDVCHCLSEQSIKQSSALSSFTCSGFLLFLTAFIFGDTIELKLFKHNTKSQFLIHIGVTMKSTIEKFLIFFVLMNSDCNYLYNILMIEVTNQLPSLNSLIYNF